MIRDEREILLNKIVQTFRNTSLEAHIFGSLGRGNPDDLSDIDIWITISDYNFENVKLSRIKMYKEVGEILTICEAPQNSPTNGIYSGVIFKTNNNNLIKADIYLCPLLNSFITNESKKIFGVYLPFGEVGLNNIKVELEDEYKIIFLIHFIFGSIKKVYKGQENPLNDLVRQYEITKDRDKINLPVLSLLEDNRKNILLISNSIKTVTNKNQKRILEEIEVFAKKVLNF